MSGQRKWKRGDFHPETGRRYWNTRDGKEQWVSAESFDDRHAKQKAYDSAWRKANPARNCELVKQWYARNPERIKEIRAKASSKYDKANVNKMREKDHRRRAREKSGIAEDHQPLIVDALEGARRRLTECTGIPWNLDHIEPLAGGGLHAHYNLRLLPRTWNMRKGARKKFKLPACFEVPNKRN